MPELTVVVPAFAERENLPQLLSALERALGGIDWETIIVVDDAFDGSEDLVRERAQRDRRVRCLHRVGRRGLASACIEGMLASSAPYLAVMDADLQHDEALLPEMLVRLEHSDAELVVGSRYVGGGGVGDWKVIRRMISAFATRVGRAGVPEGLRD